MKLAPRHTPRAPAIAPVPRRPHEAERQLLLLCSDLLALGAELPGTACREGAPLFRTLVQAAKRRRGNDTTAPPQE